MPKVNASETALEFVKRGWEVFQDWQAGSNTTEVTFSSLDLDTDRMWLVIFIWKNPLASSPNFAVYFNADETNTNYYTQTLNAKGTAVGAS